MSDVTRNGAFLARALGDKPICELLSLASGGSARPDGVNRYNPGRLMAGASHSLFYRTSRQASLIQRQRAFFPSLDRIY